MPILTRRCENDHRQECWQVLYGDVHVGTIAERAGIPVGLDPWGWHCGFSPAIDRGQRASGTATSFEKARADFADAWSSYLPRCTDADFEGYRRQRAWTRWKYTMQETGHKLPTRVPELRSRCFCGADIDLTIMDRHVIAAQMA
jgi:hypothetical protein